MSRITATDFWYKTSQYEKDARLDYKVVLNGNNWILDPLNPHTIMGGYGPNSELRMPQYVMPPEIEYIENNHHGSLFDTVFHSNQLGNSRQIFVYMPPGFDVNKSPYSMVLFHDGPDYLNLCNAKNILDNLISEGRIDSLVCVFIPPVNRNPEYSGADQDKFTAFIIEDIMPWLSQRFNIASEADRHLVMGASNGGNISLWIAMNHPETFAFVAAQSSNIQSNIRQRFSEDPMINLKLYLDLGLYDLPVLMPLVRGFIPILEAKGYTHSYAEYPEGHSWGFWRGHLADILEYFFPLQPSSIQDTPSSKKKVLISPNPFNDQVSFTIDVGKEANYQLKIFNSKGQQVETLSVSSSGASKSDVVWNTRDGGHLQGMYYYQLLGDGRVVASGKLIKK